MDHTGDETRVLAVAGAVPQGVGRVIDDADDLALVTVETADDMRDRIAAEPVACVLVDGRTDGAVETVEAVRAADPAVPILVVAPEEDHEELIAKGATDVVDDEPAAVIEQRLRNVVARGNASGRENAVGETENVAVGETENAVARETGGARAGDARATVDRLEEGLYALDRERRVTDWNARMEAATGIDAADAVGADLFELFPELRETEFADALSRALDDERETDVVRLAAPATTPAGDGDEVRFHVGDGGVTVHELGVDPDLRRDARLLEDLLNGLLAETGDTVYFKDEESRFIRVSRSKARETGSTREQLRGKSDFDFMAEAEAQRRYEDEQEIMRTGEPLVEEEQVTTPNGEIRWFHTTKLPRYDEEGNVVGTFGLSRDITELKELEERLSELEAVIERVPVWLLALDDSDTVTWANEPTVDALSDRLVGKSLEELADDGPFTETLIDQYSEAVEEQIATGATDARMVGQETLELPGGEQRVCDVHVRLLPLADGQFRGAVLAFHDVTAQVRQERDLQRQNERLQRLVETVSHDLRNPMSLAASHLEIAREGTDNEHIEQAAKALQDIESLVDDLLTMAHEGRTVDDPVSISVHDVAHEAWRPFADGAATLTVTADTTVDGDPDRLRRLFANLFRNAIEHGGDDVAITVESTENGFAVADDGEGIASDDEGSIFEHGYTTSEDGTGFGLAIVSEIVEAHGWEISVTESEHGGARFEIDTREGAGAA